MKVTDNNITPLQWELILNAFHDHCKEHGAEEDEPHIGDEFTGPHVCQRTDKLTNTSGFSKRRQFIYDNYDRHTSPGLEFILIDQLSTGSLFVYSGSEQALAPITFDEGIKIAQTFFTHEATELSEHIVCNHVMNRVYG
jgi:hypothetical protein